jgi:hypothetical protein
MMRLLRTPVSGGVSEWDKSSTHWRQYQPPAATSPSGSENEPYAESLELGRLVLEDAVPANGESWFVNTVESSL